ncbi:hypothetical protein OF83DRAFT_207213 [Amylostereum chailletii]|nr:hypothetical protein OF83DRAFT_207213 [Amylostereum chailletii]
MTFGPTAHRPPRGTLPSIIVGVDSDAGWPCRRQQGSRKLSSEHEGRQGGAKSSRKRRRTVMTI